GIADDMKGHALGYAFGNVAKIIAEVVVIGRQSQRPRQWLKAGVTIGDRMQRADAGMSLRMLGRGTRAHIAGPKEICRTLACRSLATRTLATRTLAFALGGMFHGTPPQSSAARASRAAGISRRKSSQR